MYSKKTDGDTFCDKSLDRYIPLIVQTLTPIIFNDLLIALDKIIADDVFIKVVRTIREYDFAIFIARGYALYHKLYFEWFQFWFAQHNI